MTSMIQKRIGDYFIVIFIDRLPFFHYDLTGEGGISIDNIRISLKINEKVASVW